MAEVLREIASNVAKTRASLAEAKKDLQHIQTLQDALKETLDPLWSTSGVEELTKSPPVWKEFLALVASARIITVSAQAEAALSTSEDIREGSWLADGRAYSRWIGTGVVTLAITRVGRDHDVQTWKPVSGLCAKSFGIGYTDDVVDAVVSRLVLEGEGQIERVQCLVQYLPRHEQRAFMTSTLHLLSKRFFSNAFITKSEANGALKDENKQIAACAAFLKRIIAVNEPLMSEHLTSWLSDGPNASTGLCRTVIAALSEEDRESLLEKVWQTFSDKLYIKHTPATQQEALMRILLLCAGVVHKATPMQVYVFAHSSFQTSGISARLGSTSQRARFLGMALGTAISQLVDKPDTRMTFDFDEGEERQLHDFQDLLQVDLHVGSLDDLRIECAPKPSTVALVKRPAPSSKAKQKPVAKAPPPKIMVIEEDNHDEDEGLTPMAKPDSDASDSDPDPTVTRRDKPKAPVYIRTLLTALSTTSDPSSADTHTLALHTAPSLIRRKATFGSELLDQSHALASTLASLPDPFHLDDFHTLQAQGMIALLVALPRDMGPWFANAIWTGEYNIAQRVGMMTAMGLAGRELAGYGREGGAADDDGGKEAFASERLPERLHRMYTQDSEISALAKRIESSAALTPAAGTTTKRTPRRRTKLVKNELSKMVADHFFLPLTSGYRDARGVAGASIKHVLPPLLTTLSLLLSLSAKSTPSLPTLTTEYWALLLSVRTRAISDPTLLEALLFGLLSVFEAWADNKRALAEGWGREVVETARWGEVVFERLEGRGQGAGLEGLGVGVGVGVGGRKDEQGQRCRMLAAGMLMAAKEVVEGYQRLLVGEMVGWT